MKIAPLMMRRRQKRYALKNSFGRELEETKEMRPGGVTERRMLIRNVVAAESAGGALRCLSKRRWEEKAGGL